VRSQWFEPGATELFAWLKSQNDGSLVLVSNVHEFIALETGVPAIPIPPDRQALDVWLSRITEARHIAEPRAVFVLNPTNGHRGYWIAAPASIIERFDLRPIPTTDQIAPYLFAPAQSPVSTKYDRVADPGATGRPRPRET
jgi:hypothetical protein